MAELLADAHRAERELLTHARLPGRRPAARAGPGRAVVRDRVRPDRRRRRPRPRAPCCGSGSVHADGGPALRLRYRTDVLDADGRRPDRRLPPHRARADRRRSGRRARAAEPAVRRGAARSSSTGWPVRDRELPDRRFHELFEQRVAAHPDAVAARARRPASGPTGELNARANRLGRALLARGLQPRGRGRGGDRAQPRLDGRGPRGLQGRRRVPAHRAALPGRPRSRPTLTRAECRLVLTERGSTDHARPGPGLAARGRRGCSSTPPTRRTTPTATSASRSAPDQLAYIYFTSGSTGEPKGAMCEHAGMLNHLHAKIARPGDRRGGGGRPDRAPVLRHLAVAAGVGAAGRRADAARRAGGDPRRRAVRRHDRRRPGRACCRSCRRTSRSCCPTWSSTPASCRTCTACRPPARR